MFDFKEFDGKLADVKAWLEKEFSSIRTGRATVTLLDGVMVDVYGSRVPLNQVATISQEDPRTLKLNLFDANQAPEVEQAINNANLGVSTSTSISGTRVIFPDLTSERREVLVKQAKIKLEDAKISIRTERDKVWTEIQDLQKNGDISEDDKFRLKDEMEAKVGALQKALDETTVAKETEISS